MTLALCVREAGYSLLTVNIFWMSKQCGQELEKSDIKMEEGDKEFQLTTRQGFRWWWAFTKKHNIISLYYQDNGDNQVTRRQSSSPENLLNLLNNKPSLSINIPSPSNHFLPFLSLTSQSKYSINHPDYRQPPRAHANTS